jgi:outer membrane protein assembly factor BamD (BamD/ComL family)
MGPAGRARDAESLSRREIAQLVRLRALIERDPAAAYRLAKRAEREFPRGILAEERQALAIVALARSGAIERARTRAAVFFARYPQSPLRETVDAALRR